ncbi:hypothetical protein [Halotia branconii]|uniref:Uncharacterized protein n=1 Tax=Halotia branconii CENA392 TaxID=1539056 RepID=A0AAJ6NV14_9CYAN|nr:hypothetical protein [Halotia branconii]WGV27250.1 hypothetical protein QI031_07115 [Halotia branconii CENA392]
MQASTIALLVETLALSADTIALLVETLALSADTIALLVETLALSADTIALLVETLALSADTIALLVNGAVLDDLCVHLSPWSLSELVLNFDTSTGSVQCCAAIEFRLRSTAAKSKLDCRVVEVAEVLLLCP